MSFPAYPKYKEAGFVGLDKAPKHWQIFRFKQLFEEINQRSESGEEELLSVSEYYGVKPRAEKIEEGEHLSRAETLEGYKICQPGDLVMNIMLAWKRGLGISMYHGIVSPAYAVFRLVCQANGQYYHYLLRSEEYIGYFKTFSSGVIDSRLRLYPEVFGRLTALYPPKEEQTQIARFLDHETARIDALIEEQQRLIELLKEKRQALTLTAFQEAGHLERRLEHVVEVVKDHVAQVEGEFYTPLGLFNRGRGMFHKEPRENKDMGDSDFYWVHYGDLIISGQFAWEGAVALAGQAEERTVVSHRYPLLRGKAGILITEYIYSLLTTKHGDFLLNESSRGAAGRNRPLNLNSLLKEKIPIPPMELQEKVAELVHEEAKIKNEANRQVKLLQERRSALISAAVTGKIDVRNWQPESSSAVNTDHDYPMVAEPSAEYR